MEQGQRGFELIIIGISIAVALVVLASSYGNTVNPDHLTRPHSNPLPSSTEGGVQPTR